MSKDKFDRGITDFFVDALNNEYGNDSWWRKIVDDKDLFLGIRNECLNVYYNGSSILKLEYNGGKFSGKVHHKYLKNTHCKKYVRLSEGDFDQFYGTDIKIQNIKNSTNVYQGEEKKSVHEIIMRNTNVIDTEIRPPGEHPRIDFAALRKEDGVIKIVFYEAKMYSNSDLRSKTCPKILGQVKAYQEIVCRRRDEIVESYQRVACNIDCMSGWRERRSKIFSQATTGNLIIDPEVRIVIFGDDDAKGGATDNEPTEVFACLRKILGTHRVLTTECPVNFSRGIESPE